MKTLKPHVAHVRPRRPAQEIISEQPQRFFVSELIREKIFFRYDREIPYSSQV